MILFVFLPTILENKITKKVSQSLELETFQINIKKLGFLNTIIGEIKTGQSLEIDYIDIEYSLRSLIKKKIKVITVSGLTIQANVDEKYQVTFEDYDLKFSNSNMEKDDNKAGFDFTMLPFLPEKIELKNSKILLNLPSQQIIIPLEVSSNIRIDNKTINANAVLMPFGEKIEILATLDSGKNDGVIKIESKLFDLSHLSQIIKSFAPEIKIPNDLKIDLTTNISTNKESIDIKGILAAYHPLIPFLPIKYGLNLDFKNNNFFTFKAANQYKKKIQAQYDNNDIIFHKPVFEIALEGNFLKAKGNCLIKSEKGETQYQGIKAYAKNIKINTDFKYDFTQTGRGIKVRTDARLVQVDVESSEHKVKITRINATFPFEMPFRVSRPAGSGKFSIGQCVFDNIYTFKAGGSIDQIESGILINGDISSPGIKDFKLTFNSKAMILPQNNINGTINFHSKPFKFSSENLSGIIPKSTLGINFDMNLSSKGKIEYSSKGITSSLKINVKKGSIVLPENNLTINGITTDLEFKDLLTLQSKPAQVLSIDSIKFNDISMNGAKIKYNIESKDSIFVENTRIKWCNGIVSSEALRVPSEDNDYAITLFCDRLELTKILEQIGAFNAEGNGTMSGRIPVTYSNGVIAFDNAFLFSTPGQGGKIIIDNADMITSGIPIDTIQFSQLDLAKEALKNYDYKWAKLNFNTFEDTLFVNMKFDGTPSKKVLPFEYKEELGSFVRVDASSRGSHFQGIKLDVNLKLPFNQVMKFGNKLKETFK